ncbi:alcohol dehydrogenase-like regulatory protein ErcA [Megalodesulfovibrio paquesii]
MDTQPEVPWFSQWRKFVAPEMVFGLGALEMAGRFAANLRAGRVLVVSDPALAEISWVERLLAILREAGLEPKLWLDVSANPKDTQAMAAAEYYQQEGCDGIVALGGGSPMDLAKAVGIISSNQAPVLSFAGVDNVEKPGPPLICLPTTAGTGAEVSQFAIITDTTNRAKIAIVSKTVIPDVALLDPELTCTMGPELTAYTGLDALTHAVEAYVSNASSPLTDMQALEAMRRIGRWLPEAVASAATSTPHLEARSEMLLASLQAGMAFSNAILGAVHAMAHSLGGYLDLPHGLCNALLLDHVIEYNFSGARERYRAVGNALGAAIAPDAPEAEAREQVVATVRQLKQAVGVTQSLADLGVTAEALDILAGKAAQDPCLLTNPTPATAQDLRRIFAHAARLE